MNRVICIVLVLALGIGAAGAADFARSVDLRDQRQLEQLQASNPAHFANIQRIVAAVLERPEQVTEGWLRTNFNAKDFSLQRAILRTSNPPKQLLQVTLDDVRYTMYVVRSAMPVMAPIVSRP